METKLNKWFPFSCRRVIMSGISFHNEVVLLSTLIAQFLEGHSKLKMTLNTVEG